MTLGSTRRRVTTRPGPVRVARPTFESLEERFLLYAATGAEWSKPSRITYSIVPDGTSVGGTPSNLNQALSSKSGWQLQIQKAAAAWEAVTGINLVQVPDNGAAIGSAGAQQGDPNFADIRIGGMAQAAGQLAFAYAPPPFNGGTNAGDIFFNTTQSWQTNATTYDLMTVAIHEFGHALGMGHSATTAACMYASYGGARQALTSDDSTGIDTVYGTRHVDSYDTSLNNSSKTADDITSTLSSTGQESLAPLDVTTSSDVDWYKVTTPTSSTGTLTVTLQSTGLSSLTPGLTLYNGSLVQVATAVGKNLGDTVRVTATKVQPGQVWYVKAMAGATGPAGIGSYGLQVNFSSSSLPAIEPPNTYVAAQPDLNPSTTAMGTGWIIDGKFTPLDVANQNGQDHGLSRIVVGTLAGYGDDLVAVVPSGAGRPVVVPPAPPASHPLSPLDDVPTDPGLWTASTRPPASGKTDPGRHGSDHSRPRPWFPSAPVGTRPVGPLKSQTPGPLPRDTTGFAAIHHRW